MVDSEISHLAESSDNQLQARVPADDEEDGALQKGQCLHLPYPRLPELRRSHALQPGPIAKRLRAALGPQAAGRRKRAGGKIPVVERRGVVVPWI